MASHSRLLSLLFCVSIGSGIFCLELSHAGVLVDPSYLAHCVPEIGKLSCGGKVLIALDGGYGLDHFPANVQGLPAGKGAGSPQTSSEHLLSLGNGGFITLKFQSRVTNQEGPDLRIFENPFYLVDMGTGDLDKFRSFTETAYVEVSQDGINFHRFPPDVKTGDPGYFVNPYNFFNLAGVFPTLANQSISPFGPQVIKPDFTRSLDQGPGGDDFDLSDLKVDLAWIQYVRVIDTNKEIEDYGDRMGGSNTNGFDFDSLVGLH